MMSICFKSAICYVYSLNQTFCKYSIFCWARISQFLHCSQAAVTYSWKCFICWMNTSLFRSLYSKIRFFSFSLLRSNQRRTQYYCFDAQATDLLILSVKVQSQFLRRVIVTTIIIRRQQGKLNGQLRIAQLLCAIKIIKYQNAASQMYLSLESAAKKEQFAQKFEQSQANHSSFQQNQQDEQVSGKAIQLIRIKSNGKIQIIQEAIDIIASCDEPVGLVSLVGKMRTGKSCLLNKILGIPDGFKVDPSTSSCTQGIWMWSQPYFNKQYNNLMFFLDTEGTDSLEKNADNDQKIFTLSLLISTYFIYNSVGSINEASLSELQMVTALSKYITVGDSPNSSLGQEQIHKFMPKFLWLLRDFMLQIEDQRKKKISPSQYLQNCLNDKNTKSSQSNKIKKSIITYFPNRECLTLVQPVDDQEDLQRLNQLPNHSLRREFIQGVSTLKSKIMDNTGPKMYQGKPITGANFSVMINSYVNAFNEGRVPNIKTAWEQIAEDEGGFAYNKALQKYGELFQGHFGDNQPKGQEIHKIISYINEQTRKQYEKQSYNNKHQDYEKKLKQFLKEKEDIILQQNNALNQSRNIEILYKHSQKIQSRIQSNYYMANKANREELEKDINEVTTKYNAQAKGPTKGEVITQFLTTLTPMITSMKADNTEAEQKMKQVQRELNEQRMRIKQLELQNKSKEQQLVSNQNVQELKKKPSRHSKVDKQDRDQGCCSGGKCQIM